MKYMEVQVTTTTEASDAVSNILYEEGATGVMMEDPNDFKALNTDSKSWDYVEEELIEKLGNDVRVKGYFNETEFDGKVLKNIDERVTGLAEFGLDSGKCIISTRLVNDDDWATAWKQYYKPVKVGERVVIKPTWESYEAGPGEVIVELDPGMAFGTGTHETTMMCIKLLEKHVKGGMSVFDVGCGSGILGITAAKLGAVKVVCVDIDEIACKVARENSALNNTASEVEVRHGNLLDVVSGKADIVIANIIADIILSFSGDAGNFMKEGGVFISSGIIRDRRDEVLDKLGQEGFHVLELFEMGEWCAIAAERK